MCDSGYKSTIDMYIVVYAGVYELAYRMLTPGLSEDIGCHERPTMLFLYLQIIKSDIKPQVMGTVGLAIAGVHFQSSPRSLCGYMWAC